MTSGLRSVFFGSLVLLCVASLAGEARAHVKSTSYSRWTFDGDRAQVELRVPLLELTRFPPDHPWPAYLADHLELLAGDEPCTATPPSRVEAAPGWATFQWSVTCPSDAPRSIRSRLFEEVVSSHLHFARVSSPAGDVREHVLVAEEPIWSLSRPPSPASATSFAGYVELGIAQLASGWAHLAFITALLLLARSLRELAVLVAAFTLAHSLTLALAVLDVIQPAPAWVEILTGFSIALVAAENGWLLAGKDRLVPAGFGAALLVAIGFAVAGSGVLGPLAWFGLAMFSLCHFGLLDTSEHPGALRALLAFAFGLVHGFGFAGVLLEAGISGGQLVPALLGFNLGVEIGLLGVVVLLWLLLRFLGDWRDGRAHLWLEEAGSAAILGLGLYWVVVHNWS